MVQTIQARSENEAQAPVSAGRPVGRLLTFRSAQVPQSRPAVGVGAATPATYDPAMVRNGYGKPLTHIFGLRISGTVNLSQPFEMRRSGGVVEVFQNRSRA